MGIPGRIALMLRAIAEELGNDDIGRAGQKIDQPMWHMTPKASFGSIPVDDHGRAFNVTSLA